MFTFIFSVNAWMSTSYSSNSWNQKCQQNRFRRVHNQDLKRLLQIDETNFQRLRIVDLESVPVEHLAADVVVQDVLSPLLPDLAKCSSQRFSLNCDIKLSRPIRLVHTRHIKLQSPQWSI